MRDILPHLAVKNEQPSPIILDSDLKILTAITELNVLKPVVLTCVPEEDERYKNVQALLQPLGGSLLNCERGSDGRYFRRIDNVIWLLGPYNKLSI